LADWKLIRKRGRTLASVGGEQKGSPMCKNVSTRGTVSVLVRMGELRRGEGKSKESQYSLFRTKEGKDGSPSPLEEFYSTSIYRSVPFKGRLLIAKENETREKGSIVVGEKEQMGGRVVRASK